MTSGPGGTSVAVVAEEKKLGLDHRCWSYCLALSAQGQGMHCRPALHIVRRPVAYSPVTYPSLCRELRGTEKPLIRSRASAMAVRIAPVGQAVPAGHVFKLFEQLSRRLCPTETRHLWRVMGEYARLGRIDALNQ
jgi:hypothetical protein